MPVVSEEYKCVLTDTEQGLEAKLFSWYDRLQTCRGLAFLYAEGENPFVLMEQCVKQGLKLLGCGVRPRSERRYPELFEYLGWCTWDAMQIRVDEADILEKCREFKEKNIPVRWAVIDDMWAEVKEFYDASYSDFADMVSLMHRSSLYSFEADSVRFPNGLKSCLDKMKEFGVVPGIWHPTTGYWRGLDKNGPAYRTVKDCLIETKDGRFIHDYKTEKAYMFYKTFHQFLRECGAEFVKIDNQSMTRRFYKGLAPVGEVSRAFHDGMEASVGQYFDNNMINLWA